MNLTALDIMEICADCGLRLEPHYERLLVVDTVHENPFVPEALFRLLVEHRDEIRDRLRVGHLCIQVLLREFSGGDRSTVEQVAAELEKNLPPCAARDAALFRLAQEATR